MLSDYLLQDLSLSVVYSVEKSHCVHFKSLFIVIAHERKTPTLRLPVNSCSDVLFYKVHVLLGILF